MTPIQLANIGMPYGLRKHHSSSTSCQCWQNNPWNSDTIFQGNCNHGSEKYTIKKYC